MAYTVLPWQKEPTDILGEIKLSLGNGQGWWYLPNKFINSQLSIAGSLSNKTNQIKGQKTCTKPNHFMNC